MDKIDELSTPPIVGEYYLVPCIMRQSFVEETPDGPDLDWEVNREGEYVPVKKNSNYNRLHLEIYPIINHLHNDRETGQDYYHYHVDYRFIKIYYQDNLRDFPIVKRLREDHIYAKHVRYDLVKRGTVDQTKDYTIEYHPFKCLRTHNYGIAGRVELSKVKHHCITKGKCPHRGYDLSQEVPVDGVITCPLHGLRFDAETKKLLT